ncbi:glutaredoxin domain-containing protein [Streptomyces brasiliensis]
MTSSWLLPMTLLGCSALRGESPDSGQYRPDAGALPGEGSVSPTRPRSPWAGGALRRRVRRTGVRIAGRGRPIPWPRPEREREERRGSPSDDRRGAAGRRRLPRRIRRPGCKYCMRLRIRLGRSARQVHWVDIWRDPAGAAAVRAANDGNETVPTVIVAGQPHTNPDPAWVRGQLSRSA